MDPGQSTLDRELIARPEKGSKPDEPSVGPQRSEKFAVLNKTSLSAAPYPCLSRDVRRNASASCHPLASDTVS